MIRVLSQNFKFLVWKLHFRQKRKSKVMGTFWRWGSEIFSDWSITKKPCYMVAIHINQWVSMEKVWLFYVTLLFNVAPLDGIFCTGDSNYIPWIVKNLVGFCHPVTFTNTKALESVVFLLLLVDDIKVFTAKEKINIADFWLHNEFSPTTQ